MRLYADQWLDRVWHDRPCTLPRQHVLSIALVIAAVGTAALIPSTTFIPECLCHHAPKCTWVDFGELALHIRKLY